MRALLPSTFKNSLEHGDFFKVVRLTTVDSTNEWLKKLSLNEAREGFVVVADEQTRGKGRLGRKFFSKKGGLYFSVLLKPKSNEVLDALTVLAAVAVCDAIREESGDPAQIKWVNDIFIGGKKCSGILAETTESLKGFAIVGIGVNVGDTELDESIKDIACSVFSKDKDLKWRLLAKILDNIATSYLDFDKGKIVDAYKERSCVVKKRIQVVQNDGTSFVATAKDIDEDCRLVVVTDDGREHRLFSGEVKIYL